MGKGCAKARLFPCRLIVLTALLWQAAAWGGQAGRSDKNVLKIGFITPVSGNMKGLGKSTLEGARLALDEKNRGGGIRVGKNQYTVVIVVKDSEDRPELAVRTAHELINRENISVLIGPPMSRLAIPVAQVANNARVPMIAQIATHPDVTKGTQCVFRTCFTDVFQGGLMAKFARMELGAKSASVLYDVASPYNRGLAELFEAKFTAMGGEMVAKETYTTGETDFTSQLLRIKEKAPDVLFLPNYNYEILTQVDQVRRVGVKVRIIGSDSMDFRDVGDYKKVEGAYYSAHFSLDTPSPRVKAFNDAYQAMYGKMPLPGAALTYDALALLFAVIEERQSVEPEEICKGLSTPRRFEGVTGVMLFDGSPDPVRSAVVLHVKDGIPRFYTQVDP